MLKTVWLPTAKHSSPLATAGTVAESKACLLTLTASLPLGQTAVLCLAVEGKLNCHTYMSLIDTARVHYSQGQRALLLDLRQTTEIELSGLFALLSIAYLYAGQSLLDPEEGWRGLRVAAEAATPALGERLKLLTPCSRVVAALERASFCQFLECYGALEAAIAAFPNE